MWFFRRQGCGSGGVMNRGPPSVTHTLLIQPSSPTNSLWQYKNIKLNPLFPFRKDMKYPHNSEGSLSSQWKQVSTGLIYLFLTSAIALLSSKGVKSEVILYVSLHFELAEALQISWMFILASLDKNLFLCHRYRYNERKLKCNLYEHHLRWKDNSAQNDLKSLKSKPSHFR